MERAVQWKLNKMARKERRNNKSFGMGKVWENMDKEKMVEMAGRERKVGWKGRRDESKENKGGK